jgi:hypothetical protein
VVEDFDAGWFALLVQLLDQRECKNGPTLGGGAIDANVSPPR